MTVGRWGRANHLYGDPRTTSPAVGTISEARKLAADGEFSAAILDVNLAGDFSYPLARALADKSIPFIFATGYGTSLHEEFSGATVLLQANGVANTTIHWAAVVRAYTTA